MVSSFTSWAPFGDRVFLWRPGWPWTGIAGMHPSNYHSYLKHALGLILVVVVFFFPHIYVEVFLYLAPQPFGSFSLFNVVSSFLPDLPGSQRQQELVCLRESVHRITFLWGFWAHFSLYWPAVCSGVERLWAWRPLLTSASSRPTLMP